MATEQQVTIAAVLKDLFTPVAAKIQASLRGMQDATDKTTRPTTALGAALSGLRAAGNVVSKAFSVIGQAARGVIGAFLSVRTAIVGVIAILSARRLIGDLTDTIAHLDKLAKTARRVQMPTKEFTAFAFAAEAEGVELDELAGSLQFATKAISQFIEAQAGIIDSGGPAEQSLRRLQEMGVAFTDAGGKMLPLVEIIPQIADAVRELNDAGKSTEILMEVFSRGGPRLQSLIAKGSEGIKEAMVLAAQLNQVFGDEQLKLAEDAASAIGELSRAWEGLKAVLTLSIAPELASMLRQLTRVIIALPIIVDEAVKLLKEKAAGTADRESLAKFDRFLASLFNLAKVFVIDATKALMQAIAVTMESSLSLFSPVLEDLAAKVLFSLTGRITEGTRVELDQIRTMIERTRKEIETLEGPAIVTGSGLMMKKSLSESQQALVDSRKDELKNLLADEQRVSGQLEERQRQAEKQTSDKLQAAGKKLLDIGATFKANLRAALDEVGASAEDAFGLTAAFEEAGKRVDDILARIDARLAEREERKASGRLGMAKLASEEELQLWQDLIRAQLDLDIDAQKRMTAARLAELSDFHTRALISTDDYLNEREKLELALIDREIAETQALIDAEARRFATLEQGSDEAIKSLQTQVELARQLAGLEDGRVASLAAINRERDVELQRQRELVARERELTREIAAIRLRTDADSDRAATELAVRALEARHARGLMLTADYVRERERLEVGLIDRLIAEQQRLLTAEQVRLQSLDAGDAKRIEALEKIKGLEDGIRQLESDRAGVQFDAQAGATEASFGEGLRTSTQAAASGGLGTFFSDIIRGAQTAKEAFLDLMGTMLDSVIRFMADRAVAALFASPLFGGTFLAAPAAAAGGVATAGAAGVAGAVGGEVAAGAAGAGVEAGAEAAAQAPLVTALTAMLPPTTTIATAIVPLSTAASGIFALMTPLSGAMTAMTPVVTAVGIAIKAIAGLIIPLGAKIATLAGAVIANTIAVKANTAAQTAKAIIPGAATGGLIPGAPSTRDSLMMRLARGEFVISSDAVRAYGARLFFALNDQLIPPSFFKMQQVRESVSRAATSIDLKSSFASGGQVGPTAGAASGAPIAAYVMSSPEEVDRFLAGGKSAVVAFMERHASVMRSALGVRPG